jgi:hypothetical protein
MFTGGHPVNEKSLMRFVSQYDIEITDETNVLASSLNRIMSKAKKIRTI